MTTTTAVAQEMEEWKGSNTEVCDLESADDDETLLAEGDREFEFERGSVSDSEDGDGASEDERNLSGGRRRSYKSSLWVVLSTLATLAGRRILTSGFPYPVYYVLLVQLGAYAIVVVVVLLLRLKNSWGPEQNPQEEYKWWEYLLIGFRILSSSSIASFAMLSGAWALLHFPNLPLLVMLPILTYVFDDLLSRAAYGFYLIDWPEELSWRGFYKVVFVLVGVVSSIYDDYRMDLEVLLVALASIFFFSFARLFAIIGPHIESKGTRGWEAPLNAYLVSGIPPLVLATYVTLKYENYAAASYIAQSWTVSYRIFSLGPAVLLQVLFASSMNTAYPCASPAHVGGALEDPSEAARDACASTLQAGFWVLIFASMGKEKTLINWLQVIFFTLIYILTVGPRIIAYYPPRALNLILRLSRKRPLPIRSSPWQFIFFMLTTTIIFGVLIATNTMFLIDTIAYNRSLRSWLGPKTLNLDSAYRPPVLRSFDIIIAHSEGDPISHITDLISTFAIGGWGLQPKVLVYTTDPNFNITESSAVHLRAAAGWDGSLTISTLKNVGGVAASHIHHILYAWDQLPVQSLFLSTSLLNLPLTPLLLLPSILPLYTSRLNNYFIDAAFPLPDALPKTGFLNLGEMETCSCTQCFGQDGWEDTFHLVPSMFAAARPGFKGGCDQILLTHGNNFVVSAARIRGLKKDVWEMLYDALVNEDEKHAWAHAEEKLPKMGGWETGRGRWEGTREGEERNWWEGKEGVYARPDSLERPYLGMTVERLWGVLLQCSEGRIAWRCPNLETGWRTGGEKEDCGCVD